MSPLQLPIRFNGTAERLVMLDDTGRSTWAEIGSGIHSVPGPVEGCGYLIKPGETAFVPLNASAYFWDWGVSVDYFSEKGGVLEIKTSKKWSRIPLPPGIGSMQTVIVDEAAALLLSSGPGSGAICVTQVAFGEVKPGKPIR